MVNSSKHCLAAKQHNIKHKAEEILFDCRYFEYTAGFAYLVDKRLLNQGSSGPKNANLLRN